jgi:ElaB/YqjD/DUF883 family membrane-anchored ribosome-binding protein
METSDNTVRALDAANDVVELMRLTHSALHRAHNETYGEAHELAARLSHQLHSLRQTAEILRRAIEKQAREAQETTFRGEPRAKASTLSIS